MIQYTILLVKIGLRDYPFVEEKRSEAIDFASYWGGTIQEQIWYSQGKYNVNEMFV